MSTSSTTRVASGSRAPFVIGVTGRPQKRHNVADARMGSAQNGHGRRRAGRRNSSSPASGVKNSARKNHPTPERPNSREARMPTASASRIYSPAPISIDRVYPKRRKVVHTSEFSEFGDLVIRRFNKSPSHQISRSRNSRADHRQDRAEGLAGRRRNLAGGNRRVIAREKTCELE